MKLFLNPSNVVWYMRYTDTFGLSNRFLTVSLACRSSVLSPSSQWNCLALSHILQATARGSLSAWAHNQQGSAPAYISKQACLLLTTSTIIHNFTMFHHLLPVPRTLYIIVQKKEEEREEKARQQKTLPLGPKLIHSNTWIRTTVWLELNCMHREYKTLHFC